MRVAVAVLVSVLLVGESVQAQDLQLDVLIDQLGAEDWRARGRAAVALRQLGPDASVAVPALVAAFRNRENEEASLAALQALVSVGTPAVPALIETLGDPSKKIAYWAHSALVRIGPSTVVPLSKALQHRNARVRGWAGTALQNIGPPARAAVPALLRALADTDWEVRISAALALSTIDPAALPPILNDEREHVRDAALKGIMMIEPSAYDLLIQALSNRHAEVRSRAAHILAQHGAKAASAIPGLLEALGDENRGVRRGAADALTKIGAELKANGDLHWWVPPLAFKLELGTGFLVFAIILTFIRRVRPRKELRLFLLLVGSLGPILAVLYVTLQGWVAVFLPEPGLAVVSTPTAAALSVAFGCALASVWAWHKNPPPEDGAGPLPELR